MEIDRDGSLIPSESTAAEIEPEPGEEQADEPPYNNPEPTESGKEYRESRVNLFSYHPRFAHRAKHHREPPQTE